MIKITERNAVPINFNIFKNKEMEDMRYTKEFDIYTFEFWSGAKDTVRRVQELGKMRELQELIEDIFNEGATETEINDFVWFEDDMIEQYIGVNLYED